MNEKTSIPEELFAAVLEISGDAARRVYLDQACAGDAALRQEVESLLAAHEKAGGFMVAQATTAQSSPLPTERAGDRIGRYKLLEQIGEGGFGVVWMAEQEEPVRRRVALKIIKLGMDTREVVARFEAERQALAMMDHPSIASVFDGGATDTGRPYFVMELVKGIPITQFCDERKLCTRERLELFMQVCQAVQHAHQKGVIHRDLKPSNVLVTVKDDRPVPKVIDFGVAKATQARLTEKTLFTRLHQWIGTPAYMSPEQAGLASLDVDTRSDVYSLGVLLYELLTGRTPFDTQKLMEAGYDAVMRTIREEEPPKPSTRLSTLAEQELNTVAAKRGAEPAKLGRLVRGDLDWIVMKALEKDRTRRYETPNSFARDLERYLNQEPVSAVAPTVGYRLLKFARRNRAIFVRTLTAGGVAALGTLVALVGVGKFYGRGPLKSVFPASRILRAMPRVDWERAISDVYVRDYSVTGPGIRMHAAEPYLFVRVNDGPGGWRALDLTARAPVPVRQRNLAYVHSEDGGQVIELALEDGALAFGRVETSERRRVVPAVANPRALAQLIAVPRTVRGLVVACLPDEGLVFAFEEKTGRVAWKSRAADHIQPEDLRGRLDQRIGYLTADEGVVAAGMWSSRVWAMETTSGKHMWSWKERWGNAIYVLAGTNRVFGFSASGLAYALDRQNGALVWKAEVGRCDEGDQAVLHSTNLILCPSEPNAGSILALSQADGQVQWKSALRGAGWERRVSCAGDFLVVSTGRTVQRFNPATGAPGTFLELPTLKDQVVVRGESTAVGVSHPLLILRDEQIVAFTIDGSLWGLNLPPGPPQAPVTAAVSPSALSSTNGAPTPSPAGGDASSSGEQGSGSRAANSLPAFPTALAELETGLTSRGQRHIWDALRNKIIQDWDMAQVYAQAFGRQPHLIAGRLRVPDEVDPTTVAAQMRILEGGYFCGPVGDLRLGVSFRHLGCLPLDISLTGRVGALIWVGDVELKLAPADQLGGIRGTVVFPGATNLDEAEFSVSAAMGPVNTPSNGTEPGASRVEPIRVHAGKDGAFLIENLAPIPHFVSIQHPSGLPKWLRGVSVAPGTVRDLGKINLEQPLRIGISWLTAPTPSFKQATLQKTEVLGDGEWQAQPRDYGHDLRFLQEDGQLRFSASYIPCRLVDLGQKELNAELPINTDALLFSEPRGEVRAGHVYLFHQQHFEPPYWVLFRIDRIDPSRGN